MQCFCTHTCVDRFSFHNSAAMESSSAAALGSVHGNAAMRKHKNAAGNASKKRKFYPERGVSGRATRSTRGTISPCSTACLLSLQSPICSLQAVRVHPRCPTKTEHSTPKSFPPPSPNASLDTAKHPPQAHHCLDSVITSSPVLLTVV